MSMAYPTTTDVTHVVRNTVVDPTRFRGKEILDDVGEHVVEIKVDVINATQGLAGPRALGGQFQKANLSSNTVRTYATAYWGDNYILNEKELLEVRMEGTLNERAGYQRVIRRANELNVRLDTLTEKLKWDALVAGKITAKNNGVNFEVAYGIPSKNAKTYDLLTDANFDVIEMFDDIVNAYVGTGARADKVWMNTDMSTALAKNQSFRDLFKQSAEAIGLTASNVPTLLSKLFPSLSFEVYPEGYQSEKGIFVPFIPKGSFVVTGKGHEKLGDFCSTLAVQNGGIEKPQPGKFGLIEDKSGEKVPYIDCTVGINGLPRLHHPEWIIRGKIQ